MRHVLYVCDACCEKKQITTETPGSPPPGWWIVTSKRDNLSESVWKTQYACREDCKTEVIESVTRDNRGFAFELRARYVKR